MLVPIGKTLEVAEEGQIVILVDGRSYKMSCTPRDLDDFIVGFVVSEGISDFGNFDYSINFNKIRVSVRKKREEKGKVEAKRTFSLSEVEKSLIVLDIEEYKKTRGYHVAAVIGENIYLRYDIGRLNSVDKAIGAALRAGEDLEKSFLILSGRISGEVAMKCVRSGIPLVASKAAILSLAIEICKKTGLSAISFATGIAYVGKSLRI